MSDTKILNRQIEAVQLGTYCTIIKDMLIQYRSLSIVKIAVFSFILKKQSTLQIECYNAKNTTDLVLKALTQIAGRQKEFLCQIPYILQALDLLIKNNICDQHQGEIMCRLPSTASHHAISGFLHNAILESHTFTDRQFLKEVISIV